MSTGKLPLSELIDALKFTPVQAGPQAAAKRCSWPLDPRHGKRTVNRAVHSDNVSGEEPPNDQAQLRQTA